ncbi:MAG: hypothetical protein H6981_03790 [Gammaproteobacteria bacterium]|nr:hypothetical protein [Gammaproteobacteria bacterium]MCP5135909.1 hypothetical protein [Gammaproteobacteria bacterium]
MVDPVIDRGHVVAGDGAILDDISYALAEATVPTPGVIGLLLAGGLAGFRFRRG